MKKYIYSKIDLAVKKYAKEVKLRNPQLLLSQIMDTLSTYLGYRHYHELKKEVDKKEYNKKGYINLHEANEYQISVLSMEFLSKILKNKNYANNYRSMELYFYKTLIREKSFNKDNNKEMIVDLTKQSYYLKINHVEFEKYIFKAIERLKCSYANEASSFEKKALNVLSQLIFVIIKRKYSPSEQIEAFVNYIDFEKLSFSVFPNMPEKDLYDEYVEILNTIDYVKGNLNEFIKINKVLGDKLSDLVSKSLIAKDLNSVVELDREKLLSSRVTIKSKYYSSKSGTIDYFDCLLNALEA
jgi:hypothetical protein